MRENGKIEKKVSFFFVKSIHITGSKLFILSILFLSQVATADDKIIQSAIDSELT